VRDDACGEVGDHGYGIGFRTLTEQSGFVKYDRRKPFLVFERCHKFVASHEAQLDTMFA
jgi:hypothetical protein